MQKAFKEIPYSMLQQYSSQVPFSTLKAASDILETAGTCNSVAHRRQHI